MDDDDILPKEECMSPTDAQLSRRERQVMDIIYRRGEATASDVLDGLEEPSSRSAVRTFLRILEEKGHLKHTQKGKAFVYKPTKPRRVAGRTALRRVLKTFFEGSVEKALSMHLADPSAYLSDEELERLADLLRSAKKKRKRKGV